MKLTIILTLTIISVLIATYASAEVRYTVTDLGFSGGRKLNDLGQVAGDYNDIDGYRRACIWDNGVRTDLGTFGGSYSF